MKDPKATFKALGTWWIICFLPILLFRAILVPALNVSDSGLYIIISSVVLAVLVDLLLYFVIFPITLKQLNEYQIISGKISQEGLTEEVKNMALEQYKHCSSKKFIYREYFNEYALILAEYYCACRNFEEAYKYIESIDAKSLVKESSENSSKLSLIKYCCAKLQIECDAGDEERAKMTYNLANEALVKYGQDESSQSMILSAMAAYDVLRGKEELAIKKLEPVLGDEDGYGLPKFLTLAKAYKALEEYSKATRCCKEALRFAKADVEKKIVLDELKTVENV